MIYPRVFPVAFLVVICLIVTVTEVNGLKYSMDKLRSAVNSQCCGSGKRGIQEQMPHIKKSEAKRFIVGVTRSGTGLHEECCDESCDNEEINEGSANINEELGEECLQEGCSIEEIKEHC